MITLFVILVHNIITYNFILNFGLNLTAPKNWTFSPVANVFAYMYLVCIYFFQRRNRLVRNYNSYKIFHAILKSNTTIFLKKILL